MSESMSVSEMFAIIEEYNEELESQYAEEQEAYDEAYEFYYEGEK